MDARTWLGLEETDDPLRYRMPVTPAVSSGMGALFGGAGLAAGIEAMETASGRPVVWATAQYLSYARPPAVLDIEVVLAVTGHQVTQARAVARAEGREILTVNAALGRRPQLELQGQWAEMPDVPGPEQSPPRLHFRQQPEDSLATRIEARMAKGRAPDALDGTPGDGRTAMWARIPEVEVGSTTLAVLGDFVPSGIGQASVSRPGATASTTRCACRAWCPPTGCCSTSASTPSTTGSGTASCTCGPRTARSSAPPASPPSSVTGRTAREAVPGNRVR